MSLANKLPKRIGKCNLMSFFAKDLVKRIMSMLLIPHDQCDQIRRNFTTLATFFKNWVIFTDFSYHALSMEPIYANILCCETKFYSCQWPKFEK